MELAREYARLHFGRGKLTLQEYVQYGVYDASRLSPEEQERFVTNNLHWPITHACCDMTCQGVTEDKWLCASLLGRAEIRVPETLAVIDAGPRTYPGTHKIATAAALRDFLTARDVLPLFGKENRGICSFGAVLIVEAEAERLHLKGAGWTDYDTFMGEMVGATPYLLQRVERNHGFFDRYTDSLATVRVCILLAGGEIRIPFAVLKLPAKGNVADNFWRPGNLACDLDPETGRIRTVRSKDALGTTDYDEHPATNAPLKGECVPMWDRVLDMARDSAPIFQAARYQSMDIAITAEGPVLVEVNTGGGFDLPQLASGWGFITDEVGDFFRSCGYARI
jgi:hypothetical protein